MTERFIKEMTERFLKKEEVLKIPDIFIKKEETAKMIGGVSIATLYRMMHDPEVAFPKPVQVGSRRVAFRLSEVVAWMESRPRSLEVTP